MPEFSSEHGVRCKTLQKVKFWKTQGKKIGFTNGCFDLLHPGHISLLKTARESCDRLVVGLNSDVSVQQLKGTTRPVKDQRSREIILMALEAVNAVIVFAEETPLQLITEIKPDILVKGADYNEKTIVGADVVQSYGGEVLIVPLLEGYSSTKLIEKIGEEE